MDYDRILVLSEGKVAELDSPKTLMNKSGSIFRGMYNQRYHHQQPNNKAGPHQTSPVFRVRLTVGSIEVTGEGIEHGVDEGLMGCVLEETGGLRPGWQARAKMATAEAPNPTRMHIVVPLPLVKSTNHAKARTCTLSNKAVSQATGP